MKPTRREVLGTLTSTALAAAAQNDSPSWEIATVKRYDDALPRTLKAQITDTASPYCGGMADASELHHPISGSGIVDHLNSVFHHPKSRYYKDTALLDRMKLALSWLERSLSPDGNIDNVITNFNSPPDTAFAVIGPALAAYIAKENGNREIVAMIEPFLKKAGEGLIKGGVHTPNHRWVMCAAMASINAVMPDSRLVSRIDQWLAEGIDIDEDGQYDERSLIVYNPITDQAFVILADRLKRPKLLDPVRSNLDSALYLMHANQQMVTEISRRQDRNQKGDIGAYWFAMHYMAAHDGNAVYAGLAAKYAPERASLSALMGYPQFRKPLAAADMPPDNYEKHMKSLELVRIRRGITSATIMLRGDTRFFMLRHGEAAVGAVRFASAFFGKAQFKPQTYGREGNAWVLKQSLWADYYQPLTPPYKVKAMEWDDTRPDRPRTERCFLEQMATIREVDNGFEIRIQAHGTTNVPVAIEVNVPGTEGLVLDGLLRASDATDAFVLPAGKASFSVKGNAIQFGPGRKASSYTQVRGAEPKLPGAGIYLTGTTPFDHTLSFDVG